MKSAVPYQNVMIRQLVAPAAGQSARQRLFPLAMSNRQTRSASVTRSIDAPALGNPVRRHAQRQEAAIVAGQRGPLVGGVADEFVGHPNDDAWIGQGHGDMGLRLDELAELDAGLQGGGSAFLRVAPAEVLGPDTHENLRAVRRIQGVRGHRRNGPSTSFAWRPPTACSLRRSSAIVASMKFIAGLPMKPATKILAGRR